MKATILATLVFLTVGLISCNEINSDPFNETSTERVRYIDDVLLENNWAFHHFWNAGLDATSPLSGYRLEFKKGGSINVTDGTSTVTGSWETRHLNAVILVKLDFNEAGIWNDLSREWEVTQFPLSTSDLLGLSYMVTDKNDSYRLEMESF